MINSINFCPLQALPFRVSDPGGFYPHPDPTFEKKVDTDPTSEKKRLILLIFKFYIVPMVNKKVQF